MPFDTYENIHTAIAGSGPYFGNQQGGWGGRQDQSGPPSGPPGPPIIQGHGPGFGGGPVIGHPGDQHGGGGWFGSPWPGIWGDMGKDWGSYDRSDFTNDPSKRLLALLAMYFGGGRK